MRLLLGSKCWFFWLLVLDKGCFGMLRAMGAGEAVGVSFGFLSCLGGLLLVFSFYLLASL